MRSLFIIVFLLFYSALFSQNWYETYLGNHPYRIDGSRFQKMIDSIDSHCKQNLLDSNYSIVHVRMYGDVFNKLLLYRVINDSCAILFGDTTFQCLKKDSLSYHLDKIEHSFYYNNSLILATGNEVVLVYKGKSIISAAIFSVIRLEELKRSKVKLYDFILYFLK